MWGRNGSCYREAGDESGRGDAGVSGDGFGEGYGGADKVGDALEVLNVEKGADV